MVGIGWRRYMKGMVSAEILGIQNDFVDFGRCSLLLDIWAKSLVMKLLEITHGQWLYGNVQVHDAVSRLKAVERKEELQREIEHQVVLGGTVLGEQDRCLLEINVGDLDTPSGENQYYWLLAIQAVRVDRRLKEMQVAVNTREHMRRRRAYKPSHIKNMSSCFIQEVRTFDGPYYPEEILDGESPIFPVVHTAMMSRLHAR